MNLDKLFPMQKVLDDRILDKHPELKGQNNLDWKILALQVELGECANEWRGFKKWSKDREPRTRKRIDCEKCDGTGIGTKYLKNCSRCKGSGKRKINPLLEEFVDCLHFILSIGNEVKCEANQSIKMINSHTDWILENRDVKNTTITEQFIIVFADITEFYHLRGSDEYYQMASEFFILGEKLGFTDKQVEQAYISKNEINHARQQNGY